MGRLYWCLRVPGVVGVAHSRMLRVGGNRVIMRNSNVGSGHNPAPMCNTDDTHAHQALSQMPRHTTISSRNSTDLGGLSRVAIGRRRF